MENRKHHKGTLTPIPVRIGANVEEICRKILNQGRGWINTDWEMSFRNLTGYYLTDDCKKIYKIENEEVDHAPESSAFPRTDGIIDYTLQYPESVSFKVALAYALNKMKKEFGEDEEAKLPNAIDLGKLSVADLRDLKSKVDRAVQEVDYMGEEFHVIIVPKGTDASLDYRRSKLENYFHVEVGKLEELLLKEDNVASILNIRCEIRTREEMENWKIL